MGQSVIKLLQRSQRARTKFHLGEWTVSVPIIYVHGSPKRMGDAAFRLGCTLRRRNKAEGIDQKQRLEGEAARQVVLSIISGQIPEGE